MAKKHPMKNISVLLADADSCLAQAAIVSLRAMGFVDVSHVRSAAAVLEALKSQLVHLLICEWDLGKGPTGLELVRALRQKADSPHRTLPIILLTGRGEAADVQAARDSGITEIVVKPFSAQTLFNRLERVVDEPRHFILSTTYMGPERRRRGVGRFSGVERRGQVIVPVAATPAPLALPPAKVPVMLLPDDSLQRALGTSQGLASRITPEMLKEAQRAIDGLGRDAIRWIEDDLEQMKKATTVLNTSYSSTAFEQVKDAALSIKSRAGTFGFTMASDVARLLFLFLSTHFASTNPMHLIVIQKHLDVLTVIFARQIRERVGLGVQLYAELERLISVNK